MGWLCQVIHWLCQVESVVMSSGTRYYVKWPYRLCQVTDCQLYIWHGCQASKPYHVYIKTMGMGAKLASYTHRGVSIVGCHGVSVKLANMGCHGWVGNREGETGSGIPPQAIHPSYLGTR